MRSLICYIKSLDVLRAQSIAPQAIFHRVCFIKESQQFSIVKAYFDRIVQQVINFWEHFLPLCAVFRPLILMLLAPPGSAPPLRLDDSCRI